VTARFESVGRPTRRFAHDLAISAVPFDAMLVADVLELVSPRLQTVTTWPGVSNGDVEGARPLRENESRVALVLYQRLWGHDLLTEMDELALRQRMQHRRSSVLLVLLDETKPPDWLASIPKRDLATSGVDEIARFVCDAIATQGGAVSDAPDPIPPSPRLSLSTWPEPVPFLAQFRAHGTLRRELDLLTIALRGHFRGRDVRSNDCPFEFLATPNRLFARVAGVAVSLSWLAGRGGAVSDGRLLVVEWAGVAPASRGLAALAAAEPVRERVYRAEALDGLSWRWRVDAPHGSAYSSADLVGDWLSGMELDGSGLAAEAMMRLAR
jgi:hypothetical protein